MPDTTKPRRMSREDRRASLLAATADLLRGPDRVPLTFDAIAAAAGVSATLPYKYFANVDELAAELYQHLVGAIDDETDRILADPERSFDDKVRDTLVLWTDAIRRDGLVLLRLTDDASNPGLRRLADERRERSIDVWAEQIRQEFALDPIVARVVAASITAGSNAALRCWVRDGVDRGRVIELFVKLARAQAAAATGAAGTAR